MGTLILAAMLILSLAALVVWGIMVVLTIWDSFFSSWFKMTDGEEK